MMAASLKSWGTVGAWRPAPPTAESWISADTVAAPGLHGGCATLASATRCRRSRGCGGTDRLERGERCLIDVSTQTQTPRRVVGHGRRRSCRPRRGTLRARLAADQQAAEHEHEHEHERESESESEG